jgi:hypothetical protein
MRKRRKNKIKRRNMKFRKPISRLLKKEYNIELKNNR